MKITTRVALIKRANRFRLGVVRYWPQDKAIAERWVPAVHNPLAMIHCRHIYVSYLPMHAQKVRLSLVRRVEAPYQRPAKAKRWILSINITVSVFLELSEQYRALLWLPLSKKGFREFH